MLQNRKKERNMLEEKFTKKCAVSDLYEKLFFNSIANEKIGVKVFLRKR